MRFHEPNRIDLFVWNWGALTLAATWKERGKVRQGMPDFPNAAARARRDTSWPYFWTVTIAVCVNMA